VFITIYGHMCYNGLVEENTLAGDVETTKVPEELLQKIERERSALARDQVA
jgi:sensor domain CHASE-containing protein